MSGAMGALSPWAAVAARARSEKRPSEYADTKSAAVQGFKGRRGTRALNSLRSRGGGLPALPLAIPLPLASVLSPLSINLLTFQFN